MTALTASPHLRGILIAGALAATALVLAFVTFAMNGSAAHAGQSVVLPHHSLAARHAATKKAAAAKARAKTVARPNVHYAAAIQAGLPPAIAHALASSKTVVVQLTSSSDSIAQLAAQEAKAGAKLAGVGYLTVSVDTSSKTMQTLTRAIGSIQAAPETLVYTRPGTLFVTLNGYNDKTTVQQAAANAASSSAS